VSRTDTRPDPLPEKAPPPPPVAGGTHDVQLLRNYPNLRHGRDYPFARGGERSVARGYAKALSRAGRLVYLEDRYLWSAVVAAPFAEALAREPGLRLIAVLPPVPERGGRLAGAVQVAGRHAALAALYEAGGARVGVYSVENHEGTPVYVNGKVCVVDDVWAAVGSADLSLRSWTRDSGLSAAVVDQFTDAPGLPATLRRELCGEHLDQAGPDSVDLRDGPATFAAFAAAADALEAWHAGGRVGPRPPGRLRHYHLPPVPAVLRPPARWLYHRLYDPDGRPRRLRRTGLF
jgi:phosphatidylserine/phosphatidylglycerophosphate/cardiolipin synthase-like enzyme